MVNPIPYPPNIPPDDAWLTPYLLAAMALMLGTAAFIRIGNRNFPGSGFIEWICVALAALTGLLAFFANLVL
jgi:hypothetical protein